MHALYIHKDNLEKSKMQLALMLDVNKHNLVTVSYTQKKFTDDT